jgi:hypothetical protein
MKETEFTLRRTAERMFYDARGYRAKDADIKAIEETAETAIKYVNGGHGETPWLYYIKEVAHFARNNGKPSADDFEKWMLEDLD